MEKLAILGEKGGCSNPPPPLASPSRLPWTAWKPQLSIWTRKRPLPNGATGATGFPAVVSCQVSRLDKVLEAAEGQGAQLAIIDTPGKSTDAANSGRQAADFVLIPIRPQMYDIETLDKAKDILTLAGNPPSAVLISLAPMQGRRHIETQEILAQAGLSVSGRALFPRRAWRCREYRPDSPGV